MSESGRGGRMVANPTIGPSERGGGGQYKQWVKDSQNRGKQGISSVLGGLHFQSGKKLISK